MGGKSNKTTNNVLGSGGAETRGLQAITCPHLAPSVCGEALRPLSGGWGDSQDSLLPWGISLEPFPPASVALLLSLRAAAAASSASTPALLDSASSETEVCSCCRPHQLALFSPMWPNMVWDKRVSEKRAHSANSGSTTYVMKPEEDK